MNLTRFRTLARNWEAFGRADPFFGVLSDPTRHGGKWGADEFFESGDAHVDKLFGVLLGLGVSVPAGRCLDFGCGVGRLTLPLSRRFDDTVGVDVARSMVALARRHADRGGSCRFVVNKAPDLRRFADRTFDVVHSCLVLQHIPPDVTLRYVAEFLRVCRPGGLVIFQLPAESYTEEVISERYALPQDAYAARLALSDAPAALVASKCAPVHLTVTNESPVTWRHDIPAGRHLTIANHWLRPDGSVAVADDGRTYLTRTLEPGATCDVKLRVQAPAVPGEYLLEVDLVQERVCWFAEKGSPTARAPVTIARTSRSSATAKASAGGEERVRTPLLSRLRQFLRRLGWGTPTFEMHVVPRAEVEQAIRAAGGQLLHAIDDGAAGYRWLSYTYVCQRL